MQCIKRKFNALHIARSFDAVYMQYIRSFDAQVLLRTSNLRNDCAALNLLSRSLNALIYFRAFNIP